MHVLQLSKQGLQIRLSDSSPNSDSRLHLISHLLVGTIPQYGAGHCCTHLEEIVSRKLGVLQDVHSMEVCWQVLQLSLQVLQIRLSLVSPYSFELLQAASHRLVELFPHDGLGQTWTQLNVDRSRKAGAVQDVQVVARDWHVLHYGSQVLQILLSDRSPNSFR